MRTMYTRVGSATLRVSQLRGGSFSVEIFRCRQRSEQAFVLGLLEMYVKNMNGVSTGRGKRITEGCAACRSRTRWSANRTWSWSEDERVQ